MAHNLTQKILAAHSTGPLPAAGEPIALRMDQALTQDATGTMAWLQFEALGVPRVKTDLAVSYVDHNTLQMGFRNPDDHRFLRTAAARFGAVFSPAGTGICHQLHLENFAKPGATLIGSDSHTPTAGGIGSFAMGAGGLSVALAMAGQPYVIPMPKVVRVTLTGSLQGWASAKDIILHLLGLLSVKGGVGKVFEYAGPGVATLTVPERATITNMGAELGATTSLFPSDEQARQFLAAQGRAGDWQALAADEGAAYDEEVTIDLNALQPLAAAPHMPDNVVTVASLAGLGVDQVAIGSCTNSSYADLAQAAAVMQGGQVAARVDASVNPGSKQVLAMLAQDGGLVTLLQSGMRVLECACGACIGMGASPVSQGVSVRTFNRNFEGRSGTKDANVYLVSPLTAAQVARQGQFTDPAGWGTPPAKVSLPATPPSIRHLFHFPSQEGSGVEITRGPNIVALEMFAPLGQTVEAKVVITLGDNITTDHIMPAGAEITALRSNLPAISEHVFGRVDAGFVARARAAGVGVIVAGENYGQGSSREHAALAPRHLGVRVVLAKSLARIHRANLVNFGIIPFTFVYAADYAKVAEGAMVKVNAQALVPGGEMLVEVQGAGQIAVKNDLSPDEWAVIRAGGFLNHVKTML
ncbi:aconitate hydratase [Desulfovibrio cuneatus]|uniref:aconitate hydratase n=1 Tax=Desulfovibrio cuneatus TaxID=159728 RepID=UPI0004261A2A|nr:aconitate hydratase [Desulfovibrio cuneatus]